MPIGILSLSFIAFMANSLSFLLKYMVGPKILAYDITYEQSKVINFSP